MVGSASFASCENGLFSAPDIIQVTRGTPLVNFEYYCGEKCWLY